MAVVAALVLVLVVVVGVAAVVLLGGDGSDTTADADGEIASDDEVATEASYTVAYYGTDDAVRVGSSTVIVLYDDEDEPFEDYDLLLLAEDGTALTRHVEGGSFTPEGAEIPAGEYAVVVRDAESNEVHTLPALEVVDETDEADSDDADLTGDDADGDADDDADSTDDGDEADSADDALPETVVIKVPDEDADAGDADETGDGSDGSDATDGSDGTLTDQQLAYLLYYQRVVELQELYGEAVLDANTDGAITVGGVSLVLLVDIDADGIEELVVVWDDEGGWGAERTVEVWRYDAETGAIECVCAEAADTDGLTFSIELLAQEDGCTYVTWGWASYDGDLTEPQMDYVVVPGEDGALELHTYATTWDDDAEDTVYYFDGVEASSLEYYDFYYTYLSAYVGSEEFYLYVWDDTGEWDFTYEFDEYAHDFYSPATTLAHTQAVVEELRSCVEALFGGASAEDEEEGVNINLTSDAVYQQYYEKLQELIDEYGEGAAQESSTTGSQWMSGVCFAQLLDFNGDNQDELLVVYCIDSPEEKSFSQHYRCVIYGYNEEDMFLSASLSGDEHCFYVVEIDDRSYLVEYDSTSEYIVWGYNDDIHNIWELLSFRGYSGSVTVNGVYHETYYTMDGEECTQEEYEDAYATYVEAATSYVLCYNEGDFSALEVFEETLAFLEGYAEE